MRTLILAAAAMAFPATAMASPAMEGKAAETAQAAPSAAASASPESAVPAQPAASNAIAEKVSADWAKYDTGNKGHLSRAEFGKWMGDLRASANQPAPDKAWLGTAFIQTDVDKDAKVTASELTAFLSAAG